jgi:iron complex outermembrane recepter protein
MRGAAALALSALLASTALAQDAVPAPAEPAPRPAAVEEIVVTAQKRAEAIGDVPMTISAHTGEDLRELGVVDTRDLRKLVPAFIATESGYSTPIYTLRGVGFNDVSYSSTGTVGVYADEVSLPYAIMTRGANLDLERAEVLKGPQGTLYGRNSTGGTVNYIANTPTDELEAGLSATVARFLSTDTEAYVSGPIAERFRGRIALRDIRSQEGWQKSLTRPDDKLGEFDKQTGRGILDFEATDDLLIRLTVSGWLDHSEPQAPFAVALRPQNPFTGPITLDPDVANYPYAPDNDDPRIADWSPEKDWQLNDSFWLTAIRSEWNLTETIQATAIFSFAEFRSDGTSIPQSGNDVLQSEQEIDATLRTYGGEARVTGTFGESVNWLAGFASSRDETQEYHLVFIPENSFNFPPPGVGNPTDLPFIDDTVAQRGDTDAQSNGAFVSGDWEFFPGWKLTQGLRYTWESRTYVGCTLDAPDSMGFFGFSNLFNLVSLALGGQGGSAQGACFTLDEQNTPGLFEGTLNEDNVSTRTVLDWSGIEDVLLYLSYTRGYKSGGFPVILAARQENFAPVDQEQLVSYEGGGKVDLFDRRLHLDVAGFYYDYKDKQLLTFVLDPFFGSLPLIRNAPDSEVWGAELASSWSPLEGLTLGAAGSYIHTEVKEFVSTTAQGRQFDFAGQPFNFAPEWQGVFLASYAFPLDEDFELATGLDLFYASDTNATLEEDPVYEMPAYHSLGARVALRSQDDVWSLTVFGRNLTNDLQRTGVFRTGDSVAAFAAMPRTYGLTLAYNFR